MKHSTLTVHYDGHWKKMSHKTTLNKVMIQKFMVPFHSMPNDEEEIKFVLDSDSMSLFLLCNEVSSYFCLVHPALFPISLKYCVTYFFISLII